MKKILTVGLTLMFGFQVFGLIHINDIVPSFNGDGTEIESNIVKGSQYYLTAAASALLMLAEIEKASPDMKTLNTDSSLASTSKAIYNLDLSLSFYRKALDAAQKADYNTSKTVLFQEFSYDKFIAENNLNEKVALEVKEFMVKGDILGLYKKNMQNIEELRTEIASMQTQLNSGLSPDITLAWRIFQKISETSLLGNYSTVMAKSILK